MRNEQRELEDFLEKRRKNHNSPDKRGESIKLKHGGSMVLKDMNKSS